MKEHLDVRLSWSYETHFSPAKEEQKRPSRTVIFVTRGLKWIYRRRMLLAHKTLSSPSEARELLAHGNPVTYLRTVPILSN